MNKTIFRYIFMNQIRALLFVGCSVFCLIMLFNFAEVTRRFPISHLDEFLFAIKLSFLGVPSTFCETLHYVYFITATLNLWSLSRSHQLTILKAAGRSPKQILAPFIACAGCISLIWLFVLHPIGVYSDMLRLRAISNGTVVGTQNENIWVDHHKNNQLLFFRRVNANHIDRLCIFSNRDNSRILADSAEIVSSGIWKLQNVAIVKNSRIFHKDTMDIPNVLSNGLVDMLSQPPERQDIYKLYKVHQIRQREEVSLRSYELALHKLLSHCMSFIMFALIAAVICFPINRYKTKTNIALKVIFSGILLRFADNVFEAFAHKGIISVQMASWTMTLAMIGFSLALLIWREA